MSSDVESESGSGDLRGHVGEIRGESELSLEEPTLVQRLRRPHNHHLEVMHEASRKTVPEMTQAHSIGHETAYLPLKDVSVVHKPHGHTIWRVLVEL